MDGNAATYWESANNAFPQWLQVDLGAPTDVGRIVLKLPDRLGRPHPDAVRDRQHRRLHVHHDRGARRLHVQPGHRQHRDDHVRRDQPALPAPELHRQHRLARRTGVGARGVRGGSATRGALTVTPGASASPSQTVGTTSPAQAVTLQNPGTGAASISSIGASGDFAQTNGCGGSLAAGASCTINVTFTPTAAGARTGTLTITSNAPGSPTTASLSGTGVASGTNLALGKTMSASSSVNGAQTPNFANDDNPSSYWESANNAFPQWLQVDLGAPTDVGRIVLRLPPSTAWGTRTQTLSVAGSSDGSTFTTIVASAGYTFNPATGNTVTITFAATSRRFIRLNFTANTGWPAGQVSELQVFAP